MSSLVLENRAIIHWKASHYIWKRKTICTGVLSNFLGFPSYKERVKFVLEFSVKIKTYLYACHFWLGTRHTFARRAIVPSSAFIWCHFCSRCCFCVLVMTFRSANWESHTLTRYSIIYHLIHSAEYICWHWRSNKISYSHRDSQTYILATNHTSLPQCCQYCFGFPWSKLAHGDLSGVSWCVYNATKLSNYSLCQTNVISVKF